MRDKCYIHEIDSSHTRNKPSLHILIPCTVLHDITHTPNVPDATMLRYNTFFYISQTTPNPLTTLYSKIPTYICITFRKLTTTTSFKFLAIPIIRSSLGHHQRANATTHPTPCLTHISSYYSHHIIITSLIGKLDMAGKPAREEKKQTCISHLSKVGWVGFY